jgi:hypothetical protein
VNRVRLVVVGLLLTALSSAASAQVRLGNIFCALSVSAVDDLRSQAPSDQGLALAAATPRVPPAFSPAPIQPPLQPERGVQWRGVLIESGRFLLLQHAFRFAMQDYTRAELKGKFFDEWGQALHGLDGWEDGDSWKVNYVGHPMQGAITNFIFIQNDPAARALRFQNSRPYWRSRLAATGYSALYSLQFELGPLGEAALGNVGKKTEDLGYVDLVVTPVGGFFWTVMEDVADRYLMEPLEDKLRGRRGGAVMSTILRGFLNPARTMANSMRPTHPWHRDQRQGLFHLEIPVGGK